MRLEPLYRATFTTPGAWSAELAGPAGTEGQSFLIAEGRCDGRVSGRFEWSRIVPEYPYAVWMPQPALIGTYFGSDLQERRPVALSRSAAFSRSALRATWASWTWRPRCSRRER